MSQPAAVSSPVSPPATVPPVTRREIFGWAMFDFANSSYTTIIVSVAFSVYFTKLVAPAGRGDALWGIAVSISNLLVMLASPLVGAIADDSGRKKQFLAATWLACVGGTAALWWVVPGVWGVTLGLLLFVVSNVAFAAGENLTAAFLPEISTPANMGWVSGFAWGLGYFGGLACLVAIKPLLAKGFNLDNLDGLRLTWVVTAAFFFLAALPTFAFLRERAPRGPERSYADYARVGFGRLAATYREVRHFGELVRFLLVFFVFSCGLATIIAFTGIYAESTIGFTANELVTLFIVVQLSAAGGAFLFGWVQDRLGSRLSIQISLLLWIGICCGAYLASSKQMFWGVALVAGLGIGSLQASSRALVGMLSPVSKTGEFFAFWGFASRAASVVGPLLFGQISSFLGSQRIAILATAVFFIAGFLWLFRVDVPAGRAAAVAWDERERLAAAG
jgi:UMF1 family MFS transporter